MIPRPLAPQPVRSLLALLVGILLSPALAEARPITNIDTDGDGIPNYKDNNIDGPGETPPPKSTSTPMDAMTMTPKTKTSTPTSKRTPPRLKKISMAISS